MRQAITTKYHGPTDHRGSRVIARAEAGSIVWSWDHALDIQENHTKAAEALARKFGWAGVWCGGGTRDGYTYVLVPDDIAKGWLGDGGYDRFFVTRT